MSAPWRPPGTARRVAIGVGGAVVVGAVLVAVIARRREEFVTAVHAAPAGILLAAAALQLVALLARSGAWWICVDAAGGRVGRRPLFRAASMGYLGSQLNSSVGTAARIGALRRSAKLKAPRCTVSTQVWNVRAQKVWIRVGFEPTQAVHTFHLWSD